MPLYQIKIFFITKKATNTVKRQYKELERSVFHVGPTEIPPSECHTDREP